MKALCYNRSVVTGCLQKCFPAVEFVVCAPEFEFCTDVDYIAAVGSHLFGIQIKLITGVMQLPRRPMSERMRQALVDFKRKYGGGVFVVECRDLSGKRELINREVVDEIAAEIERLKAA